MRALVTLYVTRSLSKLCATLGGTPLLLISVFQFLGGGMQAEVELKVDSLTFIFQPTRGAIKRITIDATSEIIIDVVSGMETVVVSDL